AFDATPVSSTCAFGPFRIVKPLALGGMAELLLATRGDSRRLLVLKRILPCYSENPEFIKFFTHEGELGRRLQHPHLVHTLEAGWVGGAPYIALEYLRGKTAIELLRATAQVGMQVPLGVVMRVVADAARGLHHAHQARDAKGRPLSVVHRDVTPH